jgi:hypothetical protein
MTQKDVASLCYMLNKIVLIFFPINMSFIVCNELNAQIIETNQNNVNHAFIIHMSSRIA